ncbi:fluoride efflux transporter FluC [Fructilactobacillus florum]|uniref:fluoride efflux transporter FluC n=1 Tax=Fructilactobacillus florum TaxID=640331 RepID=UPI0003154403|nr:CrcB family protein [Fructilactobacillus florum]
MGNILFFLGGTGVGAILRFSITNHFKQSNHGRLGTFLVNMIGCFIAGMLAPVAVVSGGTNLLLGFIGGFTTYSTFNSELANLWSNHAYRQLFIYLIGSYGIGLMLGFIGFFSFSYF